VTITFMVTYCTCSFIRK